MIVHTPSYLLFALAELHVQEIPGPGNNPRIATYWKDAGLVEPDARIPGDEIPWCAAFVGAMLMRGGVQASGSALAKSYQIWGDNASGVGLLGAIVVLNRKEPAPKWQGHVGFCVGFTPDKVHVLGGNQGDRVSIAAFPRERIANVRYPGGWNVPQTNILLPVTQVDPSDR